MTDLITSETQALKEKTISYIWPVATLFFVGYILLSFFITKDYTTGWILLSNFLIFAAAMAIYFKTKNVWLGGNVLATLGITVLLPWLIKGGPGGVGFWWSIVYVVWAFIVTNKKSAIFWLMLHLVLSTVIVMLSLNQTITIAYPIPTLLNMLFAYITAILYVYFLVSVLDYYLELSQKRSEELVQLNKDLEKAKIISEQSKAAKESFIANMSHEIRTPLNAIIGFQQLLKDSSLNNEQREYVESIDFAGKNLLVIINDILDISKIESGKFEFHEISFNISDVIKSVVELLKQRAKEKNVKLFISQDSSLPSIVRGDSDRFTQILLNLVGNAVKFTNNGEVKISARLLSETDDSVIIELSIEDSGIGIAADKLSLIFERFSQADTEISKKFGGTGLGLTICKYLVEMQGGSINAQSEEGKGSVFSFQLNYKKASDQKTLHKEEQQPVKLKKTALNILLAEDIALNQKLITKIMGKWGHTIDVADNGKIAVEKVKANQYDLILMDIQMPEMDGYEATLNIRSMEDDTKQKIPIIALTAHASQAEAEKCINIGMNAYLTKPFNQKELEYVMYKLVQFS